MADTFWPHWEQQFLAAAKLPTSALNIGFLGDWLAKHNAITCDRNPIDLSQDGPGSKRCLRLPGGKYARAYASRETAASAFADQLRSGSYPHLLAALVAGNAYRQQDGALVGFELETWGSPTFQAYYLDAIGIPESGGAPTPAAKPATKDVIGAWSRLMRTLRYEGHATIVDLRKSTANLRRIERRARRA
ncbi:MAG TPA: hypothetical protein VKA83_00750 [Methylomirabilota bacterium]|nr:hypothetical protein [Methylomirabilota bacterium]